MLINENDKNFYINNFIDWKMYNIFYRNDWKRLNFKQIKIVDKQFKRKKKIEKQKIVEIKKQRKKTIKTIWKLKSIKKLHAKNENWIIYKFANFEKIIWN